MIGAVSLKLAEIEKRQSEQQSCLEELKLKIDKNVLSQEELETDEPTLKATLLQFQAGIKEQHFKHNDLKSKVNHLTGDFEKLKCDVCQLQSERTTVAPGVNVWKYDPEAPEFTPRNCRSYGMQDQRHVPLDFLDDDEICPWFPIRHRPTNNVNQSDFSLSNTDPLRAFNANDPLNGQSKEEMFKDLLKRYEDQMQRERAWINKEKWYSNKLRLLRQDKRRRGDTIGKLLRSIDEMRDLWRFQNSSPPNCNPSFLHPSVDILSKVHETRTLPGDKRIEAVIEIAESEKNVTPRPPTPGCWGGCEPCPVMEDSRALSGSSGSTSPDLSAPGGDTKNDNNNCQWDYLALEYGTDYDSDDEMDELELPIPCVSTHLFYI